MSAQTQTSKDSDVMMSLEILNGIFPDLIIPIGDDVESACVDGRSGYLYGFPLRAYPGADAGLVINAYAALNRLLPEAVVITEEFCEQVLQLVIDTVGKNNFRWHTDQDAVDKNKGCGMGCGHIRHARNNFEDYLVRSEQIEYLFKRLAEMETSTNQVVLQDEHKEKAVVLVRSEKFGIKHNTNHQTLGYREVFVYHENLHNNLLAKFADVLANAFNLPTVDVLQQLQETFGEQLGQTIERLAKGYPMYIVQISDDRTFTIS